MSNLPLRRQQGFTLIELMLALAISSGLAVIAFAGQSQAQQRARFDAAVDKVVADIGYAKNYAASNVNQSGPGATTGKVVLGATLVLSNTSATLVPFYGDASGAVTGAAPAAQSDGRQSMAFATPLTFTPATKSQLIGFTNDGSLTTACLQTVNAANAVGTLCSPGNPQDNTTLVLSISDASGYTAQVDVEPKTGTARRIN